MDSYVIKVIYEEGTPWRFNYSSKAGGEDLSLLGLQTAIKDKLELPSAGKIKLNYKDDTGEFVRMTSDEDLKDALVTQALSPLILQVKFSESTPTVADPPHPKTPSRWGWGSSLVGKIHTETSASETVSDARCNGTDGEHGSRTEHQEVSTSNSFQLVDHEETQSVCDTESNSGLDEEPGGSLPHSKVVKYKCYECGMNPIVGPWYMSIPIRKQPYASCIYHLCEDCFVLRSWRHSKSIQFRLIKECAECHQYKPDVRRYPFQGNMTRQSSTASTGEEAGAEASDDILLCDGCFKAIARRTMDIENKMMSQTLKDSGSSRRSCSGEKLEMSELVPATSEKYAFSPRVRELHIHVDKLMKGVCGIE